MKKTLSVILIVLAAIWLVSILRALDILLIFEDGSWAVGSFPYPMSGCFPWGICQ